MGRRAMNAALLAAMLLQAACGEAKKEDAPPRAETASAKGSGSRGAGARSTEGGARVVLFAGTSLTAGLGLDPDSAYPQLIQAKIDSARLPFETVNAGVSGETSAGLLQRLDWLLRGNFDVMVIETGANDGLRGTPPDVVHKNLTEIVARIRQTHPSARVLLVQMEAPPNFGPQYTTEFREVFPEVAKETGATLLPFLLTGVAGVRSLNQPDGMHPNLRGEHIVADNVWRGLQPVLVTMSAGG